MSFALRESRAHCSSGLLNEVCTPCNVLSLLLMLLIQSVGNVLLLVVTNVAYILVLQIKFACWCLLLPAVAVRTERRWRRHVFLAELCWTLVTENIRLLTRPPQVCGWTLSFLIKRFNVFIFPIITFPKFHCCTIIIFPKWLGIIMCFCLFFLLLPWSQEPGILLILSLYLLWFATKSFFTLRVFKTVMMPDEKALFIQK